MKDRATRETLSALRKQIKVLESPEREAKKIARAKARKKREIARAEVAAPEQRQPRVRDAAYLAWIRRLPCVECVRLGRVSMKPSQAAHIRAGYPVDGWRPTGMQEKPSDRRVAPLCAEHHTDGPAAQHRSNERAWWATRRIHPPEFCAELSAAYDAGQDGSAVIRRFAALAAVAVGAVGGMR